MCNLGNWVIWIINVQPVVLVFSDRLMKKLDLDQILNKQYSDYEEKTETSRVE